MLNAHDVKYVFSQGSPGLMATVVGEQIFSRTWEDGVWRARSIRLALNIAESLCALRDKGALPENLDSTMFQKYLPVKAIYELSKNEMLPEKNRDRLVAYLESLPRFRVDLEDQIKNAGNVMCEQHGYLTAYVSDALQQLARIEEESYPEASLASGRVDSSTPAPSL